MKLNKKKLWQGLLIMVLCVTMVIGVAAATGTDRLTITYPDVSINNYNATVTPSISLDPQYSYSNMTFSMTSSGTTGISASTLNMFTGAVNVPSYAKSGTVTLLVTYDTAGGGAVPGTARVSSGNILSGASMSDPRGLARADTIVMTYKVTVGASSVVSGNWSATPAVPGAWSFNPANYTLSSTQWNDVAVTFTPSSSLPTAEGEYTAVIAIGAGIPGSGGQSRVTKNTYLNIIQNGPTPTPTRTPTPTPTRTPTTGGTTTAKTGGTVAAAKANPVSLDNSGSVQAASAVQELQKAIAANAGAQTVSVTARNAKSVSPSVLMQLSNTATASKKTAQLRADTISDQIVHSRLYIDATAGSTLSGNIALGVDVNQRSGLNAAVVKAFGKYSSQNFAAANFAQNGSFGMPITAALRIDTAKMSAPTLHAYYFDTQSGLYTPIKAEVKVDKKYVFLTVDRGGVVVITDKALPITE